MPRILVIGCGYTGGRIAERHVARGDQVVATRRADADAPVGVEVLRLDLDASGNDPLPAVDRVYYTAPPAARDHSDPRLAALLDRLPAPPAAFVYFSTTGVYGDQQGRTVNEDTPIAPGDDRASRRADAERQVRDWCASRPCAAMALRVAGIYGPGRLPLARIRAGEPVPDPADTGPGNRIHVDDLVNAAICIADNGAGGTWNISDGNPLSVAGFNDLVADAAGLPRPRRVPLGSPQIPAGLRSFLRDSRRIDNTRLLAVPGFSLRYARPADGVLASITG